jgi:universal stress protein E
MTLKLRRILVAVSDSSATRVTQRVTDLAANSAASVEIVSVVRPDLPIMGLPPQQLIDIDKAILESRRLELEKLARPLRRRGLEVTCTVVRNDSVSDGIAQRLKSAPADLVAIEAHKHGTLARAFLLQSDYDLIRRCPVPLLIVKTMARGSQRPVLAALDPWHAHGKPLALDDQIVAAARGISTALGAPLHSLHIYSPLLALVADTVFAPVVLPVPLPQEKAHAASIRRRFRALNAGYRISPRRSHLETGEPSAILPGVARWLKAQLVVMGAVSRSSLKRLLIGSTAERVLDALPCDVLIVKPRVGSSAGKARRRR